MNQLDDDDDDIIIIITIIILYGTTALEEFDRPLMRVSLSNSISVALILY
jgi:hypothetical protein